jgi:hypothetical protein
LPVRVARARQLPSQVHLVAVARLDVADDRADPGFELRPVEARRPRPQPGRLRPRCGRAGRAGRVERSVQRAPGRASPEDAAIAASAVDLHARREADENGVRV